MQNWVYIKKYKHEICFSIAPIEVYLLCDAAWSLKVYNALIWNYIYTFFLMWNVSALCVYECVGVFSILCSFFVVSTHFIISDKSF